MVTQISLVPIWHHSNSILNVGVLPDAVLQLLPQQHCLLKCPLLSPEIEIPVPLCLLGYLLFFISLKILFIFRERGREGEREGEKHQCVAASHAPPAGDLALNPGCAPSGNWTGDPLLHSPVVLSPPSHASQGPLLGYPLGTEMQNLSICICPLLTFLLLEQSS